ncbi:LysR family transcriptional regulator [Nisaea acidiphila]|uniref:LysR family transcriptional regulator n=1 Tax=Nisaea acidiphila TaxID=1862145 RepID=A0A9J7ALI0_9PROT|nr:LysR family transcriptional regulator [Nisaea acidiphila]UUX48507.1 LysR family transcriptional regulator [Nisaea acidiphila]
MAQGEVMLENLTGLVVFAKVVEEGGFSKAASSLGISKSSVSKQVSALEDHLGTRLLNRTTRRFSLTESGTLLYERCQRIVAEVDAAEREAGSLQSNPSGRLRVTTGMSFGRLHLAKVLPDFLFEYPDLSVDLVLNDRRVDLVEEGYDVALRIGKLEDSSLIARKLCPSNQVTVASPGYLSKRGEPKHPDELAGHEHLAYSYHNEGLSWTYRTEGKAHQVRIEPRIFANNGDAILTMAEQGAGIAQMPTFIAADSIRAGRLKPILREFEMAPYNLYALYPHARNLPLKVRVFVDFLRRRFRSEPDWDRDVVG